MILEMLDVVLGDRSIVSRLQIRFRYLQIVMKNGSIYSYSFLIIVVVKKLLFKQKYISYQNIVFLVESYQVFEIFILIKKEFGGDFEFIVM